MLEVYSTTPVELQYGDEIIHLTPAAAEFELDLESMLAAADLTRSQQPFWLNFGTSYGAHRRTGIDPADRIIL